MRQTLIVVSEGRWPVAKRRRSLSGVSSVGELAVESQSRVSTVAFEGRRSTATIESRWQDLAMLELSGRQSMKITATVVSVDRRQ